MDIISKKLMKIKNEEIKWNDFQYVIAQVFYSFNWQLLLIKDSSPIFFAFNERKRVVFLEEEKHSRRKHEEI